MSNRKKIKSSTSKDEYYQIDKFVINATQLEKNGFLQAENIETNFGFRCYLGANQFEAISKSPDELLKRLQFIQAITPTLLISDNLTDTLETVINYTENGLPTVIPGTDEESQAILDKRKAEDMLRKISEADEAESIRLLESGEIDMAFIQRTLNIGEESKDE